ncbi:2',3'-cyclic-nucleotide 3'-phosphodiesterase-like [Tubulanus polymorphus]|uniref:2',3'-cyclic-nucleotide 3'-phosphodiesterase-like n=1 Tax=Tubulanus polymorphus TaxID=672921 RepID=UPI003DA6C6B1
MKMMFSRNIMIFWMALVIEAKQPLFYGWFLGDNSAHWLENQGRTIFQELIQLRNVRSEMLSNFNVTPGFDLSTYYSDMTKYSMPLHVTAMFCGRGTVPECSTYEQRRAVREALGSFYVIEVVGFLLTPRTLGARVRLTERQLPLWAQNDTDGNCKDRSAPCYQGCCNDINLGMGSTSYPPNFHPTSGFGSKGHITLGCAKDVSAVTTGLDLVDIIQCEQKCLSNTAHFDLNDKMQVRYYGQGRFFVYTKMPMFLATKFNFYL